MEVAATTQQKVCTLLSAAEWMNSQPCVELRNKCKVSVDRDTWDRLRARIPLLHSHRRDLKLVWKVIRGGIQPVLELQRAYSRLEELFTLREDYEWLIYGMRGRDSGAMEMIERMINLLLEWEPCWGSDKTRERARTLKIHIYNAVGINLFERLPEVVYEEVLEAVDLGARSMVEILENSAKNRRKWCLCDQYYRDVIYKAIVDKGWGVLRDASNAVSLLRKGAQKDVVINNEDEVGIRDVAALLPLWFTIDGSQIFFTDGERAFLGWPFHLGSRKFIPKLRPEEYSLSAFGDVVLVPFVYGNHAPSPHIPEIHIDALMFLWKVLGNAGFPGVEQCQEENSDDNCFTPRNHPVRARTAVKAILSPYAQALQEICASALRRLNVDYSLSLYRERGSEARDAILKAWAYTNLRLIGYKGIVVFFGDRGLCRRSRKRLVIRRYLPRTLQELNDNVGIKMEVVINSRRRAEVANVAEACYYLGVTTESGGESGMILRHIINEIADWDYNNLRHIGYLRGNVPGCFRTASLTGEAKPSHWESDLANFADASPLMEQIVEPEETEEVFDEGASDAFGAMEQDVQFATVENLTLSQGGNEADASRLVVEVVEWVKGFYGTVGGDS